MSWPTTEDPTEDLRRLTSEPVTQAWLEIRSYIDTACKCFRVRECKDVDLILGQGMLTTGWHAHTLNAPGKFLGI